MELKVLCVGDVVGNPGLERIRRHLRQLKRKLGADFVIVNGENAAVVGITPNQAEDILDAGADVITLGNHTWNRIQIAQYMEKEPALLRPHNYAGKVPGQGFGIFKCRGLRIAVMNLMGRIELNPNLDNPFKMAQDLLRRHEGEYDIALLDFHAEATSEKGAMAWHLDGKVQAVWGTHTHVPTADCQILPKGCGFVTDLGMTGPYRSVLGIKPADSLNIILGGLPRRHEEAEGSCKIDAVLFTIDTDKKRCVEIKRVDLKE